LRHDSQTTENKSAENKCLLFSQKPQKLPVMRYHTAESVKNF